MKLRQSLKEVTAKQTNKKHDTVVKLALANSKNTNFVAFTVKKNFVPKTRVYWFR